MTTTYLVQKSFEGPGGQKFVRGAHVEIADQRQAEIWTLQHRISLARREAESDIHEIVRDFRDANGREFRVGVPASLSSEETANRVKWGDLEKTRGVVATSVFVVLRPWVEPWGRRRELRPGDLVELLQSEVQAYYVELYSPPPPEPAAAKQPPQPLELFAVGARPVKIGRERYPAHVVVSLCPDDEAVEELLRSGDLTRINLGGATWH
jgi:hypothetical protein